MQFKPIKPQDRNIIEPYFANFYPKDPKYVSSERSVNTILIWQEAINTEFAIVADCLVLRTSHPLYGTHYRFPLGEHPEQALKLLGGNLSFYGVCAPNADKLTSMLDGYVANPTRDFFDYVYETKDLINLSGKKLHSKKNHYNAFVRDNPNFEYRSMTCELAKECARIYPSWFSAHSQIDDAFFKHEGKMLIDILENWGNCGNRGNLGNRESLDSRGLRGGALVHNEKILAFTVSEKLTEDVALIHFEKAAPNVRGAYTAINKLHLEHEYANVKYVNREEDSGIEGLRRAKLSYHPCFMIEKFMVTNKAALRRNILAMRKNLEPTSLSPTDHKPTSLSPTDHKPTSLSPTNHNPTSLSPTNHESASLVLTNHERYKSAKTICCYKTLPGEVDTADFINQARKDGKEVYFPEKDEKTGNYIFPKQADLTIVPALAFDKKGNRLGFGGGWYDRFLADTPTYSIGITREEFLLDNIPTEPHDIPVQEVITI